MAIWARLDRWSRQRPRRLFTLGAAACLVLVLKGEIRSVYVAPPAAPIELGKEDDVRNLYVASKHASWRNAPGWWVGPWNYPKVYYYRPLTSMLYLLEYRLFHDRFTGYNAVSLALHCANALLLFALTSSLLRGHPRARFVLGFAAVYSFATPAGPMYFAVGRALQWWPAQNDTMSLTFGLGCLLLLDRFLTAPSRRAGLLAASLLCLALSISTKEMGFITAALALALILYRRSRPSRLLIPYAALTAFYWFFRRAVLPRPWEPVMFRAVILRKLGLSWFGPLYPLAVTGTWWVFGATAAIFAISAIGLRRRWSVYVIVPACFFAAGLSAQIIDQEGGFGMIAEPAALDTLRRVLTYFLALALFWRYRRTEPGLLAAAFLALVFLPILQYGGTHYFYWPAAFLGLANAIFLACLADGLKELRACANLELPRPLAERLRGEPAEAQGER